MPDCTTGTSILGVGCTPSSSFVGNISCTSANVVACNAVSQDTTTVSVLGARPTPSTTGGSQPLSSGDHSIVQPSSVSSDNTFLTCGSISSDITLCPSSGSPLPAGANAAEVLKEISDSRPTVLQDIWDALSRRFGVVDEAREALRKFQQRRQSDTESVVEFEQALRSLYRVAWPQVTPVQKEVALKTKFEEGLRNMDMQQYLRLHAMGDTVQKARRFAAAIEVPKSRKSERITTPPSHEAVQMIGEDPTLHKRMDKLEDMIRSLQVTSQADPPSPPTSSVKSVTGKQPQRQFLASRSQGEVQGNNLQPGLKIKIGKRPFIQPFF